MTRTTLVRRSGAVIAATSLLALSAATPAFATSSGSGNVNVVNTETVQVYMNADGDIETKRVYEQVALTGKGRVHLDNPISTAGLRNLDGFSGFDAKSGHQVIDTTVDGEKKLRSVSDFTGELPLDVAMTYELDGKPVEPGDLVGKSGHLVVTFDVKNTTTQTQQVSFPDGRGGTITRMAQVPVPVVGSLSTGTPSNFTNVTSKQANLAGDGKGGTKLSFTMTLFPPVGKTTTSFSYEADVTDAVVPRIDVSALPVNPLEVPTFASAADSYQGGADTGAKLTDGAVQIDSNLLKLRDGAAQLLAGLIKLRDGAGQLSDGLNDEAAPGAAKLAAGAEDLSFGLIKLDDGADKLSDGAGELATGSNKLDDGANKLAGGAGALSDGTGDALAGSKKLTAGLSQISGGLGQLADVNEGMPAASAGIEKLKAGVDKLTAGIALSPDFDPQNPATIRTVLDGLTALKLGIGSQATNGTLLNGVAQLKGGLGVLAHGDGTAANPGLAGIGTGLDGARQQLDPKVAAGGDLDQLQAALLNIANNNAACSADPQCKGTLTVLAGKVAQSKTDLADLRDGLEQAVGGLTLAVDSIDHKFIPGTDALIAGLNNALAGVNKLIAGVGSPSQDGTILNGLAQLDGGLDQLAVGVTKAVAGISKLNSGAADAYAGSGDLTNGLGRIDAGADQLSDGAGQLASGTGELRTGAGQLSDGAGQLADGTGKASDGSKQLSGGASKLSDGLGAAADGSTQLADGLGTAAGGAPKLVDGAARLSKEGTKKLIAAGELTAAQYGEMVAVIKAGADRADAESMAYGAPKGAIGRTAYSYIIEGEDGEGTRNVARALGGLATLGAAGGLFFVRRRFLV